MRYLPLLLLSLLACQLADGLGGATAVPPPSPTTPPRPPAIPQPPPDGQPIPLPPAPPWGVPPYEPISLPANLPQPLPPAPAQLLNLADVPPLTDEAWAQLAATGRWILPQPAERLLEPWAWAAERNLPLYVNDELVLLAVQMANQRTWARAQAEYLPSQLLALTAAHSQTAEAHWRTATAEPEPNPLVVEAAERNMAYFAIAGRLLDPAYPIPPPAADWVASELALISQAGRFSSPLLGHVVDYTPLARTPAGYPRALAWYRQMALRLGKEEAWGRLHAQQARLWLDQPAETAALWNQLAAGLAYAEGAQGASLPHWQAIATATASTALDVFWLTAAQLPAPQLHLLPPPSSPTAEIFYALTYNRIGVYTGTLPLPAGGVQTEVGGVRLLPSVADVAAVRGSGAQTPSATDFVGWAGQMAVLQAKWGQDEPTAEGMTSSLGWLNAIQPVLDTPAWQVGWLAETADWPPIPPAPNTLWGAEQSVLVVVPPNGALVGRLAAHQRQQLAAWQAAGWLSEGNGAELLLVDELLRWLFALGARQQAGEAFTAEEREWAQAIPQRLAYLLGDVRLPLSATLYTDPTSGQSLQAGWVAAQPQLVLVVVEGRPLAAVAIALQE